MKKNKKQKHSGFSNSKLFELLLVVFRKNPNKTFNYKQVSKILKIKELGVKIQLVDVMKEMAESNVLSEVRRGSYRLIQKTVSLVGLIKNTNKKGVFACVGAEGELFIPRELSLFALPGDEVEVLVFPKRKKKQEGEVVRVLKRKKSEFVGVIDNSSSNYFLIPDDRQVFFDVFLPPKLVKPSFLNKKVVVRVDGWDETYKNPVGRVVRVLGDVHAHESEMSSIVYDYGFALDFPKSVVDELKTLKLKISTSDLKGRVDIRKTKTFTIDPENAKDFDDAISVKKLSNGNWEVGVHIADVAQYVSKGGALDKEACLRERLFIWLIGSFQCSSYFNDLCFKPSVDRLAYSVF